MKLKVKLLRRVFCMVMCVVILACSSTNVLADELYEYEYNDLTCFRWANRNSYALNIAWININIPTSGSGITTSNLNNGRDIWTVHSDYFTQGGNPRVIVNDTSLTSWPSSGWIAHTIPAENYWIDLIGAFSDYSNTAGRAVLTSTLGNPIQSNNTDSCGTEIAYATIYYNPVTTVFARVDRNITVAHECGHALGFGHTDSTADVMYYNGCYCTATGLSQNELTYYENKY